jgi:hypothetical protein
MKKEDKIVYIIAAIPIGLALIGFIGNAIYRPKANAAGKGNQPCAFLEGDELINGKISSYDPNICVSSSGRSGPIYSEHSQNWKSKI